MQCIQSLKSDNPELFEIHKHSDNKFKKEFMFNKLGKDSYTKKDIHDNAISLQLEYFNKFDICTIFKHYHIPSDNQYWQWLKEQSEKDIKIINLFRLNHLKRLVSLKMAWKTGIWHTSQILCSPKAKVTIHFDELINYIKSDEAFGRYLYELIQNMFNISYTDLINDYTNSIKNICEYVGHNPINIVEPQTKKTNPFKLEMVISNYTQLYNELKMTEYLWMIDDIDG